MRILNALKKTDIKTIIKSVDVLIVDIRVNFNMFCSNVTYVEPALFLLTLRFC